MSSAYTVPATTAPQREQELKSPQHEEMSAPTLAALMNSHMRAQHRNAKKAAEQSRSNPDGTNPGLEDEDDEESFSPNREAEEDYHLSPKKLFPDGKTTPKTYAHATSGLTAMRAIAAQSSSVEKKEHQCTGYIIAAVAIDISDPGIFELNERKIAQPAEMAKLWCYKDKEFGKCCEKYTAEIASAISGQKLRAAMEGHLEYIISTKLCSIELAVQMLIDLTTRAARANQVSSVLQETNERGSQVMLFNEAYMQCDSERYETVFRPSCVDRSLDLSTVASVTVTPADALPGMERLRFADNTIRATVWQFYFQDLVHYLCGPMQRDQINMQAELAKYYLTASETPHALRMICDAEGNLPDINDWFPREEKILRRLRSVTVILGIPSMEPSAFDRAGNALRAMHPDFRAEFDENYKHSKLVPAGTVIPQGKWPVISWQLFKGLMLETQALVQRDLVRIAKRAAVARKHKNDKPPPNKVRCRRCRTDGHIAIDCPQEAAAACRGFEKGTCKYGRECAFGHTKAGATALVTTTTVATADTKRAPCDPKDQKSFECVGKLSDKCEGKFVLDMPFWNEKVAKDDWTLPDCCSTCRKFKKEQREQRYKAKQSSSMITEVEQDHYNDSDCDSDHECDGADDDYMLDYSISMSEASMIVEEQHYEDYMQWQRERPQVAAEAPMTPLQRRAKKLMGVSNSAPKPFSDFYRQQRMQGTSDVCSLVVVSNTGSGAATASGEAFECEAHAFVSNSQSMCIQPAVVATVPSQPFHQVWNSEHPNLMIAAPHVCTDSDTDSDDDVSSDDDTSSDREQSSEGEPETPDPGDYHRHWLRCYMRDHNGYAPGIMHEAAALEEQNSAFRMQPPDQRRDAAVPNRYSHDGFVMLGERIDFDMISTAEERAGILNSSFEESQNSIDCEMGSEDDGSTPARLFDAPTPHGMDRLWPGLGLDCRRSVGLCAPCAPFAPQNTTAAAQMPITAFTRNMSVVELQATHGAQQRTDQGADAMQRFGAVIHDDWALPPELQNPPELSTNSDGNHGCYCQHHTGFDGMCTHCMQCTGEGGCCGCKQWPQYFR
jgi:hypothetical protein